MMNLAPQSNRRPKTCPALEADKPVVLDARVVTGTGGGPDKTILNSPRFLELYGYRMLCAYMHPPLDSGIETLRQRASDWGALLLSVPDRGWWDWRVAAELLQICKREQVTIWHGHDYKSDAIGLMLKHFWPMRLVTTVHGWGVAGTRPLYNQIDRFCLPHYERVLCVSDDILQRCLQSGVTKDRCMLLENGIDTERFTRARPVQEAKARLGIDPGRLVIGTIGRLSGEKGYDRLIRAADCLLSEEFDLELWIGGEGPERPRLDSLVRELGRGDRIHLHGFVADPAGLYEAMDVFALSSLSEGLPNVLLEAMALEVPVVATRIAGIPRLIADDDNGLLVEPGSVEALVKALGRLLLDAKLRSKIAAAGRVTIETRYSFAKRMGIIRNLYDEMLGRSSTPNCLPGES